MVGMLEVCRWDRLRCRDIENVHFAGLSDVQNILSADTGISRQIEGHSFGDHLFSESLNIMPSRVIDIRERTCFQNMESRPKMQLYSNRRQSLTIKVSS
jgi:hypothetical protein